MSELSGELTELVRNLAKGAESVPAGQLSPLWAQVQELGLTGIGIPEESGGSGGELADLLLVIRELSRAGVTTPIVEASTAAFAIGPSEGDSFDTIAVANIGPTGDLGVVDFAPEASRVVIVADQGVSVVALSDARVDAIVDVAGQPAGRVDVRGAAQVPAVGVSSAAVFERLALARSSALLGSAWGAYELTRTYVMERHQFGAPLIEIPSVAGTLAAMVIRIRAAQTAVDRAASADVWAGAGDSADARFAAAASARIATAQMATFVARTSHQLHGAMGITSEYPLYRFTTALWAMRDADLSERDWSGRLGALAIAADEDTLWNELTA